jgi:hypothetical protein
MPDTINVSAFTSGLNAELFKDTTAFRLANNFALQDVDATMKATVPTGQPPSNGLEVVIKTPEKLPHKTTDPEILGALAAFKGTFVGSGFNTIFRPSTKENRAKAAADPKLNKEDGTLNIAPGTKKDDNILELNLTIEALVFTPRDLGDIPNRGMNEQEDINIQGVPYIQTIWDVTNANTGRADDEPRGIHFEPGMFLHIPRTTIPPSEPTICRMASVPHGTTINLSGPEAIPTNGPPPLEKIRTFTTFPPSLPADFFPSLNIDTLGTPRFPPDLHLFKTNKTITQALINDPVELLRTINAKLVNPDKTSRIIHTDTFTVGTDSPNENLSGSATSIPFLTGKNPAKPNANVPIVKSTFWIETVTYDVQIPPMKGNETRELTSLNPLPGASLPKFRITAPKEGFTKGGKVTVPTTQIQYAQNVMLQFAPAPQAPFNWPHVSVANLVPLAPVVIEDKLVKDFHVS